jgi:hypothetical protein
MILLERPYRTLIVVLYSNPPTLRVSAQQEANPQTGRLLRVPVQQDDASHLGLARSNPQWGNLEPQAGRLISGGLQIECADGTEDVIDKSMTYK